MLPRKRPALFSEHKEADHRWVYHAKYKSNNTSTFICVVADDTDVYILLLYVASQCQIHYTFVKEH